MVSMFQHVADVNTVFVLVPIFVSPHVALRNFNIRCRSLGFFFLQIAQVSLASFF